MTSYANDKLKQLIKSIKSANKSKSQHIALSKSFEDVAKEEKKELESTMWYQQIREFICEDGKAFFDKSGNLQVH